MFVSGAYDFSWLSGETMVYEEWHPEEPTAKSKERCVRMPSYGSGITWADIVCDETFGVTCQMPIEEKGNKCAFTTLTIIKAK